MQRSVIIFGFIIFLMVSCRVDHGSSSASSDINELVIHLPSEPDRLNPMITLSGWSQAVYEYMFLSLADYDPVSYELKPVLLQNLPKSKVISTDSTAVIKEHQMTIKEAAVWADGRPVDGHDVEFTFKMITLSELPTAWKVILPDIESITIDAANAKVFELRTNGDYFQTMENFLTAEIYPRHVYDSAGLLDQWTYNQMKDQNFIATLTDDQKQELADLAASISSSAYSNSQLIEGAGPYSLKEWVTGQYIHLSKKENWWGDQYEDCIPCQGIAENLIFQIVKDETIAIALAKAGEIDILNLRGATAQVVKDLQDDAEFSSQFDFYFPSVMRIYFIMLNNNSPLLDDVTVRKALAYTLDVDQFIDRMEGGFATRINSMIHPERPEFNKDIQPIDYDLVHAANLLDAAGWTDTNNDGTRDKIINGQLEELSLRFFISGSSLSQGMASILRENAKKIGADIISVVKPTRDIYSQNLQTNDYELFASAITTSVAEYDPYLIWHSNSIGLQGQNLMNYSNSTVDSLITLIRTNGDPLVRKNNYLKLQEVIATDQPVIFLYAPMDKLAVSANYEVILSSKRPGIFVNTIKNKVPVR